MLLTFYVDSSAFFPKYSVGKKNDIQLFFFWANKFFLEFWRNVLWNADIIFILVYIRNLMVLNLFAPIFYFFLKKIPLISIVICLIFFIFNPFNITATNMNWIKSILFYSIGAFCAIHAIDFTDSRNLFYPFSIFFILSVVLAYFTPNFIRFCWSQILLILGSFSIPTIIRRGILSKKNTGK